MAAGRRKGCAHSSSRNLSPLLTLQTALAVSLISPSCYSRANCPARTAACSGLALQGICALMHAGRPG